MTPKTVAIGAALALAGVLLGMNFPIAEVQPAGGPYALSAGGVGGGANATYVWRMNTRTGKVSVCGLLLPQAMLAAPDIAAQKGLDTPKCSRWGQATIR